MEHYPHICKYGTANPLVVDEKHSKYRQSLVNNWSIVDDKKQSHRRHSWGTDPLLVNLGIIIHF